MSFYQPALNAYQHGLDQSLEGAFRLASQPTPAQVFLDSLRQREATDWQRKMQEDQADRAWRETQRKAAHEDFLFKKFTTEETRKEAESQAKMKDWTAKNEMRGQRIKDLKSIADAKQMLNELELEEKQNDHQMNYAIQYDKLDLADRLGTRRNEIAEQRNKIAEMAKSGDLEFDDDTTDYWAKAVAQGGLGVLQGVRGKAMDANKARIMARVAAMGGPSPTEFLGNASQYKANTGSLQNLQKQHDQLTAFESTALSNLDRMIEVMARPGIANTDLQFVNRKVRAAQAALGNGDAAALNAAEEAARNEVQRILTQFGGTNVLTDSARKAGEAFLNTGLSLEQAKKVRELLKQDMETRTGRMGQQIGQVQQRITSGTSYPQQQPEGGANPERAKAEAAIQRLDPSRDSAKIQQIKALYKQRTGEDL